MTTPSDPLALLRSRSYLALLVLAAIIGVPISAAAYFFLALVSKLQVWIFTDLPKDVGFHSEPLWWPIPPLVLAGVLVALTIRYLPGKGGHSPADGFKVGEGPAAPVELPGIVLAAFATLSLGVVLGPEAPLIALGGGLGVLAVRLVKRDAPPRTATVVAAAGSFAAVRGSSEVLFSGQSALGPFITGSASYTVAALLLLLVCKGLAYGVSLSGFRGGPTFPALFLGAAGGVALSHLPGLPLVYGVAMGIGALCAVMLRLPLTSVLLATLLLSSDGLQVTPLAIVAVVVAYVASARLTPPRPRHRGVLPRPLRPRPPGLRTGQPSREPCAAQ